jgi:iron complex transport system ATP-binding protein
MMLAAENLTVRYGEIEVLKDISFELAAGEIIGIIGPNGAGKTTLIRTLNGAIPPTGGRVTIGGRELRELSRREIARHLAIVAQENETKFPVTVRDFVLAGRFAGASAFGWESAEDLRAAQSALAECELEGFEHRLMNQLSGGERQRVVLARALATGARVLLLDEPTANLDLSHQASVFRLVRKKCRAEAYSAVVITHDMNLAAAFADRLMLLDRGRATAFGTPDEVLRDVDLREVFGVEVLIDRNPVSGDVRVTTIY